MTSNAITFDPDAALADLVAFLRRAGFDMGLAGTVRRNVPGSRLRLRVYPRHDGTIAIVEGVHSMPDTRRVIRPRTRAGVTASARARLVAELIRLGA